MKKCSVCQITKPTGDFPPTGNGTHTRSLCKNCKSKRSYKNQIKKYGREYNAWVSMVARCTNPQKYAHRWYGSRGITICDRWINSYDNFILDMGRKPKGEYDLHRINSNGNYEPSNCVWIKRQDHYAESLHRALSIEQEIDLALTYRSGDSINKIARKYGVSWNAIRGSLRRSGLYKGGKR